MNACLSGSVALVADPDLQIRCVCRALLQVATEIEYAEDGRDALAIAIGRRPALVVTETRLPFISGYSLCSLLRADPLTTDALIVVATSETSPVDIARARVSGADSVLTKPLLAETLLEAVEQGRRYAAERLAIPDPPSDDSNVAPPGSTAPEETAVRTSRLSKTRAHHRFETSAPAVTPPSLRCPSCDQRLQYLRSYIGGVSATSPEQWDYYTCPNACGAFQHRQRTRRLRRVG